MTMNGDPSRIAAWGGAVGLFPTDADLLPPRVLPFEGLGVTGLGRHDLGSSIGVLALVSDEYRFDPLVDNDKEAFRYNTRPAVHAVLRDELTTLHGVLAGEDPDELKLFLLRSMDAISLAALGCETIEEIRSPERWGMQQILYGQPNSAWARPTDPTRVKESLVSKLVDRYDAGMIDAHRLAKGVHVLSSVLQENIGANHRTGRGVRMVLEKATKGDRDVSLMEVDRVLHLDEPGGRMYAIRPDLYNLMQGVAFFAHEVKGVPADVVSNRMLLTAYLPDTSLSKVRDKVNPGKPLFEWVREEFMAVYGRGL